MQDFIELHNEKEANPFKWKASPEQLAAAHQRGIKKIRQKLVQLLAAIDCLTPAGCVGLGAYELWLSSPMSTNGMLEPKRSQSEPADDGALSDTALDSEQLAD